MVRGGSEILLKYLKLSMKRWMTLTSANMDKFQMPGTDIQPHNIKTKEA